MSILIWYACLRLADSRHCACHAPDDAVSPRCIGRGQLAACSLVFRARCLRWKAGGLARGCRLWLCLGSNAAVVVNPQT
jgi:hypothetical protein